MNKVYLSDNYVIVDIAGVLTSFPKSKSEYEECVDTFKLRKVSTKYIQEFKFAEIGTWFDEAGVTPWSIITLREFFRKNTDFSSASGSSGAPVINQEADGWSLLNPGTTLNEIAYVRFEEGIRWLPGTIGGTYYPAGWYLWTGTEWVSDRNAIAQHLH